jgi:uncharacterized membrane protein
MTDQNTQTPSGAPVPPVSGGADNDKVMAILAYIIFFIPLLVSKNRSAYLNFHCNQGLGLFIVALAGSIVLGLILPYGLYMINNLWSILMFVLMVIGIINASKNETKPLPVIGNWFHLVK